MASTQHLGGRQAELCELEVSLVTITSPSRPTWLDPISNQPPKKQPTKIHNKTKHQHPMVRGGWFFATNFSCLPCYLALTGVRAFQSILLIFLRLCTLPFPIPGTQGPLSPLIGAADGHQQTLVTEHLLLLGRELMFQKGLQSCGKASDWGGRLWDGAGAGIV